MGQSINRKTKAYIISRIHKIFFSVFQIIQDYQTNNLTSLQLIDGMFYVVCSTTLVISAAQLLIFYSFALRRSVKNSNGDIFM